MKFPEIFEFSNSNSIFLENFQTPILLEEFFSSSDSLNLTFNFFANFTVIRKEIFFNLRRLLVWNYHLFHIFYFQCTRFHFRQLGIKVFVLDMRVKRGIWSVCLSAALSARELLCDLIIFATMDLLHLNYFYMIMTRLSIDEFMSYIIQIT